jgi:hypothetical protein
VIPPTSLERLDKLQLLEDRIRQCEQTSFKTEHVFHAGMYARTVRMPEGIVFTSVFIKIPTLVILCGTCDVLVSSNGVRFEGYNVIPAAAFRKTAYITRSDIELTMIFPTEARTVEEVEREFTDDILLSHSMENDIVMTCLESPHPPRS